MNSYRDRRDRVDAIRNQLAIHIKLDIAQTLRHHPHLDPQRSAAAYADLASDHSIDGLIRDLAREEVEAVVGRDEIPPAAILHLAGYRQNPIAEG